MNTPFALQITFRELDPSDALRAYVEKRAAKLDRFAKNIVGCHVTIEAPSKHHRQGGHFQVRIEMTFGGQALVIGKDAPGKHAREDAHAAIDDAFGDAERALDDLVAKARRTGRESVRV